MRELDDFFTHVATRTTLPWPPHEPHWHVHALLDPATAETLAEPYQGLITGRKHLAPVPFQWMHLTVLHSLPERGLSRRQAGQLRDRLAEELASALAEHGPIPARIGKAREWGAHGIACPVIPPAQILPLWSAATRAADDVTGGAPRLPAAYMPHVSLAYATGPAAVVPIRWWLAEHDHLLPEITLTIRELHLVLQQHDGAAITWRRHGKAIPLPGTPAPSAPSLSPALEARS